MQQRLGFTMKLKPGFQEEYKKRHKEIWPEITELLKKSGVANYTIFLDPNTDILFAVQVNNGTTSSQDLGGTLIIQKWWKYMAEIMDTNLDHSPISTILEEVFHLD